MITREEYEKDLENVLKPVDEQRMSKDEYDKRYATLEFGMIENYITPQKFVDMFNKLLAMYQESRKDVYERNYPREFIQGVVVIFIVKVGDDYTEEDLMSLHKRLSDELNEGKNNTVMCLSSDCDYDCINEYDLKNTKIIVSKI